MFVKHLHYLKACEQLLGPQDNNGLSLGRHQVSNLKESMDIFITCEVQKCNEVFSMDNFIKKVKFK